MQAVTEQLDETRLDDKEIEVCAAVYRRSTPHTRSFVTTTVQGFCQKLPSWQLGMVSVLITVFHVPVQSRETRDTVQPPAPRTFVLSLTVTAGSPLRLNPKGRRTSEAICINL